MKKPNVKKLEIVAIHWLDAQTDHGWQSADESDDEECLSAYTIGFLILENKNHIVVASTSDGVNNNGRITIPIGMVKSIKRFSVMLPLSGIEPAKKKPKPA